MMKTKKRRRDESGLAVSPVLMAAYLLLAVLVAIGHAQHSGANQGGCSLLDKSRSAQFISYEEKLEGHALFSLHNNTNCAIVVETDDRPDPIILGSKNRIYLHYLMQDRRRGIVNPAYGWSESVFNRVISGGAVITFSVRLVYFRKRLDVAVPF